MVSLQSQTPLACQCQKEEPQIEPFPQRPCLAHCWGFCARVARGGHSKNPDPNPKVSIIHPRFLKVLLVVVVDTANADFAVDFTTPAERGFLGLLVTGFLVMAPLPLPAVFRGIAFALPSLDSPVSLALRVARAAAAFPRGALGATVAVRFVRAVAAPVAPPELELEVDVVVTFLSPLVRVSAALSERLEAVPGRVTALFRGELDLYR